jgi:hypothetical protein
MVRIVKGIISGAILRMHIEPPSADNKSVYGKRHSFSLVVAGLGALLLSVCAYGDSLKTTTSLIAARDEGIQFQCDAATLAKIRRGMQKYFKDLYLPPRLVGVRESAHPDTLTYTLLTPDDDTDTMDFVHRPEYWVYTEVIELPDKNHKTRTIRTSSEKEILLALLQHGRLTEFSGKACSLEALREHIGVRQNIVAWAEKLEWHWPDGDYAHWNPKFWNHGVPNPQRPLYDALADAFLNQSDYSIGCYAAIKLTMSFAILDYYQRVHPNRAKQKLIEKRLLSDKTPLSNTEPYSMWHFERDYDKTKEVWPGKLLELKRGVASRNFVPGDWLYLLNTDSVSYQRIGYEGSNSIYLGRGFFVDFYNDVEHRYTFEQKFDEVYQWRHGIFSHARDFEKVEVLSKARLIELAETPENGGILFDFRASPFLFGHQKLPDLHR